MQLYRLTPILVALATGAGVAASPASAQHYRPDAEGYPCETAKRLAVVEDAQGFSIRRPEEKAPNPPVVTPTTIAIGSALRLDTRLFAQLAPKRLGTADAPRR